MDEWERRLANILGIEQTASKSKSSSIPDSRALVVIVTNRTSGEVLISVPAIPNKATTAKSRFAATLRQVLQPGGSAKIARADLIDNNQMQQLIRRGILTVRPVE